MISYDKMIYQHILIIAMFLKPSPILGWGGGGVVTDLVVW